MSTAQELRLAQAIHEEYVKGYQDAIVEENVILNMFSKRNKMKFNKSGDSITRRIRTTAVGTTEGFAGLEEINFAAENLHATATWPWKGIRNHYMISEVDLEKAKGDKNAIFNLQEDTAKIYRDDLFEAIEDQLYKYPSGTTAKMLDGLGGFMSNSITYANIAQGTYTWWNVKRVNGDAGANSNFSSSDDWKTALTTAIITSKHGAKSGKVDIMVTDDATYVIVHNKLSAFEKYENTELAKGGFTNFTWLGVPLVADKSATAGHIYGLNFDYLELWHLTEKMFKAKSEIKLSPQCLIAVNYALHQLVCESPRHQFDIYGTN